MSCHTRSPDPKTRVWQPNLWAVKSNRDSHWKTRHLLPAYRLHNCELKDLAVHFVTVLYLPVYHAELAPGEAPRPRERGQSAGQQAQDRVDNRPQLLPPGEGARLGDRGVEGRPQNAQEQGSDHRRNVGDVSGGQEGGPSRSPGGCGRRMLGKDGREKKRGWLQRKWR